MANFDQLKQSVAALIRTNGAEEITGQIMQDVLLTIINSISGGYMFGGVAQHSGNVGNPDYNVFYLAGSGAYTGYGDAINIPNGCYGVFRYNGSWTQDVVDIGVHLTGTIREGETNGVTGDVINTALQQLFNNIMNILDTLTFTYNTPSGQQATKAMLDVIVTPTGGASHVLTTLTLVSATAAAAGLMSAEDKQKVDRMLTDFRSLSFSDTTAVADQATKIVQTLSATLGENPEAITTMTFLAATAEKAGLLSAADKAKLDALWSSGYQFVGIATPSTTPISTTSKIFYIATEAGTYFNAVTVTQGINILSWDGTAWTAVQVVGIDDQPVSDSDNFTKSGGIFSHVQERGKLLYKGAWLYENNVVLHRSGVDHTLVPSTSYDLLVFEIPNNASAFELQGVTGGIYDLWPSDDLSLWKGNYFLSSLTNDIRKYPTAKYVSVGIKKSDNSTAAAEKYANVIPLWTNDIDKSASCGSMNFINSDAVARLAAKKRLESVEGERQDGYVNQSGKVIETSDYCHYVFTTTEGKTYHIHIPSFTQSSNLSYTVYLLKEVESETKYNISLVEGTGIIANVPTTIDVDVKIPADVIGLIAISRDSATGVPTCWEVEIQDTPSYVEDALAPTEALLAKNAVAMSELTLMEPDAVEVGKFMQDSGAIGTNASFSINKYDVTSGKVYTFSGKHSASVGIKFLAWMDSYNNIIKWEPYGGVSVQFIDQPVIAPVGAAQAWFNIQNAGYPSTYNFKSVGEPIAIRELLTNTGELIVTKIGNDIYVRTKFNATKDIIQHYTQGTNECMKPVESWIGDSLDTDDDIMIDDNRFHVWGDSNAPIYCTTHLFSPWHLFGNHGLFVPCVKTVEAELTTDDEGSIWKDYYTDKTFILGKVVVNDANPYVVLIPTVTESSTQGIYTWSWYYNDDLPTKLVYVSGEAIHTDDVILNGARVSNFQISPVLESVNRKFLCDGSEIKDDGTYRCSEFTITETLIGLNPATVTTWYPSPVRESEMVRFTYNYTFSGLSTRFDVGIDVKYPICCDFFGGNQAQHTLNIEGYDIYVFAPRSKKQVAGHATDVPFKNNPSDQSSRSIVCNRNTSDCYDVDKMPDRLVSYLQDSSDDSKLIGFASGLSLTRGITKDAERKNYIPVGSLCYNNSIGQGNKMYIVAISSDAYENHLLPTSLIGNISSYFSYYDPNANEGQVYWYKDGKDYVIYAHYQSAQTKTPVNLPVCMEGLSVEIVDKTAGVLLLTDIVENGKVFLSTTNENNNYIVLKTK